MDDESGEFMEPMEEVPLKELGESQSGASRGIPDIGGGAGGGAGRGGGAAPPPMTGLGHHTLCPPTLTSVDRT